MQNLDLWLDFVDTREVMPLFEKNAKEYTIPKITDVDWSAEPEYVVRIAKQKDLSTLNNLDSEEEYNHVFKWCLERGEGGFLLQCFKHLLARLQDHELGSIKYLVALQSMLKFLESAPLLSMAFARIQSWTTLPASVLEFLEQSGRQILQAQILSANRMQEFVVEPFKKVMSQIRSMSFSDFADLVELISVTVRFPDVALDLIFECLEPESARILSGPPAMVKHFVRNLLGIALDHIDAAAQPQPPRKDLVDLKSGSGDSEGYQVVECRLRVDAPAGTLAATDHVRLTVASPPVNSPATQAYSIDALAVTSQPGLATFRCFHPLPSFFDQCSWELQNCGSFVTTKTMFDAVRTFATEPRECCHISDHILGIPSNEDRSESLSSSGYNPKNGLNVSQNSAVETSLQSPLTCLWGPPGTGKTHTIVEIIKQLQASSPKRRILVTAPTHNAVDNVMRKYLDGLGRDHETGQSTALRVSTDVS